MEILKAEIVERSHKTVPDERYAVLTVQSLSNPEKSYRVDVTNKRCSCPAWTFQKGARKPCKHLRALGVNS